MKNIILALAAMVVIVGCAPRQSQQSLNDESAKAMRLIENKEYTIRVNRALPNAGRSFDLTTGGYSLTVKGDDVISVLPYFGRAYSVPYGGGEGLRFEGEATNYVVTAGRRGSVNVSFDVRTTEDRYRFNIELFSDGTSTIVVNPNNKRPITFYGMLYKLNE